MRNALLLAALAAISLCAQTPTTPTLPTFDVASVSPSRPGSPQHTNVPLDTGNVYSTISPDDTRTAAGGLFIATRQPIWRYISFAYKLSGTQELSLRFNIFSGVPKSGAPFWVTGSFDASPEFFDIQARAPADTSIDQMRLMMQALLADRFHLAAHFQTADAPAFALTLVRPGATGPNLRPHPVSDTCAAATPQSDPPAQSAAPSQPQTTSSPVGDLPPVCGVIAHVPSSAPGQHFGGRAIPLSLFANSVPTMTGLAVMPRPIVDQTSLSGLYDFTLNWTHDTTPNDTAVSDKAAAFRDALKTQLGVELKPTRAPIDILVIDQVDHPSPN
jgi:uncharacterized protein (TIGR03435 family)